MPFVLHEAHQWRLFKVNPWEPKCPGSGTEIIPGKHSDTRMKPLPLTNGHGRCTTVTSERALVSIGDWGWTMAIAHDRYKFVTVSLPKRFRNGRFTSEAATWTQK
jgi:hypothetical protein